VELKPEDFPLDPVRNDTLRTGGLMRCCTDTWGRVTNEDLDKEYPVGSIIPCDVAPEDQRHRMIRREGGYWEWLREDV
jgi:hypothetical protein